MIDMTFRRYWRMLQSKDVKDVSEAAARVEERLAKTVKLPLSTDSPSSSGSPIT